MKANYKKIIKEASTKPLSDTHLQLNNHIRVLANHFTKNKDSLPHLVKEIKNEHEKAITFLISNVLIPEGQYDSVKYYNQVLITQKASAYWLGRSESMFAWTKYLKNDNVGYIASLKKSLASYEKSNHKRTKYRKIQILIALLEFFTNQKLTANANELVPVIKYELENYKRKDKVQEFFILLKISEIKLLLLENKTDEAFILLNDIDIESVPKDFKTLIYEQLLGIYFGIEDYKKAFKYFDLLYNDASYTKEFNTKNMKNFWLFIFAVAQGQIEDAKKYKTSLDDNAFIAGDNMIEFQQYYAQFYEQTKNYDLAYKHIKKLSFLKDSIFTAELSIINSINNYNLIYEKELNRLNSDNYQKKIDLKNQQQKSRITLVLVSVILSAFFLILFYSKQKKQYKTILELEKTKEILSHKNNFLETIAHEMRTPITVVLGYLSLIQNNILNSKKVLHYTNIVIHQNKQLIGTLNNFLHVSQLKHKINSHIVISSKNIGSFLEGIVNNFAVSAALKNINLYYKTNIKQNILVDYNYDALQKILENLITNALKYSNGNSAIYVDSAISEQNITLIVKDEGFGITAADQSNIFDKFYQSKAHGVTGGFGIGLSLVNELIKQLKGSITVLSEPTIGSIFTVVIPHQFNSYQLFTESVVQNFRLLTADNEEVPALKNLPKALIVDDNVAMIAYYKELLSDSLHCFFAGNGNEALAIAQKEAIEIIISDYRMPIMDGMEFKKILNKDSQLKDIPFIMISAVSYDFVNDPKMALGFNDYIVKPFDKNEIIARINALLKNKIYAKNLLLTDKTDQIEFKDEYAEIIERVNGFVNENLHNTDLTIKTIASNLGYTQSNLNKILQRTTGFTLVKIILEIRLQKAYEYIVSNKYSSLSELMYNTGFNSRPYFYRKFKERFGIKVGDLKKKFYE